MSKGDRHHFESDSERLIHAPWEKSFDKLLTPFEEFVQRETTSGLLLMSTALLALVMANSTLAGFYGDMLHTPIGISVAGWELHKSLHHWINDGLMALFFFVVGLELKRSLLVGELAEPRQAALPIIAAIGGMVVPALIYFAINPEGNAARGWGIPMATDIAFALGAIALLAGRVPKALITFLVALAIADDLGAVIVIALFYTEQLMFGPLLAAALLTGVLVVLNRIGVRRPFVYFLIGILLWLALLKSGVHATLAGVITAFVIPARPRFDTTLFSRRVRELMDQYDAADPGGETLLRNEQMSTLVQRLEIGIHGVLTPLQKLEYTMHMPVAFLVLPLFALFNAGIPIDVANLGSALAHPVTLGIGLGLVCGKFVGIAGASWLAVRAGLAQLPAATCMHQICGAALLGGIGFTMSIFITELAFAHQPELVQLAKLGILTASLAAGIAGFAWLYLGARQMRTDGAP